MMKKTETIYWIVGFMGAGKSWFLSQFALSCPALEFYDLDVEVENSQNRSICEIVKNDGWERFRAVEQQTLRRISCAGRVISLGGGAFNAGARTMAKDQNVVVVWVDTPFEVCWERIRNDRNRPLVQKGEDFVRKLYAQRLKDYRLAEVSLTPEDFKLLSGDFTALDLINRRRTVDGTA